MKIKSIYFLALLNFVLVALVSPVHMLSNSGENLTRNPSLVIETNYVEIPTTLNKRDSRFLLYLLNPINQNTFVLFEKYEIVLFYTCLIEFIRAHKFSVNSSPLDKNVGWVLD